MHRVEHETQLQMLWPTRLLRRPPAVRLPRGYALRLHRPGDEEAFFGLMARAGWPGWDQARLRPWRERLLPEGWFIAVHQASGQVVGTAMAFYDAGEFGRQGGEIGWVAVDPDHRGRHLGMAVSAAATARLVEAGVRPIHLYTEDFRLAALKTYLKLGYVPYLCAPDMPERWRQVCVQVGWPFAPAAWRRELGAAFRR